MQTSTRLLSPALAGLAGIGLTVLLAFPGAAGAQAAAAAGAKQGAPTQGAPPAAAAPAVPNRGMAAGTEVGFGIFQNTCLKCHGNAAYPQAPSPSVLRTYSPERIYDALSSGEMKAIGDTLSG